MVTAGQLGVIWPVLASAGQRLNDGQVIALLPMTAGVLSHQVEQLVKHACELYYIGSDCLDEHLPELDVAQGGSSLSMKVSCFTKTLSLACNGRGAWTHLTEIL
jgi:hypothetical protein